MASGEKFELHDYPVQLNFIAVRELFIKSFVPPSPEYVIRETSCEYTVARSAYDAEKHSIEIGVIACIGGDSDPVDDAAIRELQAAGKPLFRLRVHIMGNFAVDEKAFPIDKLIRWSDVNAPYILYPFLREHVYALTARCGFRPVILPMVTVPTFKVEPPQKELPLVEQQTAVG
jgi:hypothetical protein